MLKIRVPAPHQLQAALRIYAAGEQIDNAEPQVWTVRTTTSIDYRHASLQSFRLAVGKQAAWEIDELRIGTSWQSVTKPPSGLAQ